MLETEPVRATIEDLYREPGKAELVNGSIVRLMPTGLGPNYAAGQIYRSLADFASASGTGFAGTDGLAFTVGPLRSGRESFCPDASFFPRELVKDFMRFVAGPPALAVEVRSERDYGPAAEVAMALKRADYFEAGTKVVWDVDPVARRISVFRTPTEQPDAVYSPGEEAEAEPAVPGWRVSVDWIFA